MEIKKARRFKDEYTSDGAELKIPGKEGIYEVIHAGIKWPGVTGAILIIGEIYDYEDPERRLRVLAEFYPHTVDEIIKIITENEDLYGLSKIWTDPNTEIKEYYYTDQFTEQLQRATKKAYCSMSPVKDRQIGVNIIKNKLANDHLKIDDDCKVLEKQVKDYRYAEPSKNDNISSRPAQKELYAVDCLIFTIPGIEEYKKVNIR